MSIALKITASIALMTASMAPALAVMEAQLNITGNVTPVSCNLGPGVNTPTTLSLGNAAPGDFQHGGGSPLYVHLYTVPGSLRTFAVTVNGCSGMTLIKGGGLKVKINAYGRIMGTNSDKLFGGGYGQKSNAGVTLAARNSPSLSGHKVLLGDGDEVVAYVYREGEMSDAANGSTVLFDTMMASIGQRPRAGGIDAPITFTVDYQ